MVNTKAVMDRLMEIDGAMGCCLRATLAMSRHLLAEAEKEIAI